MSLTKSQVNYIKSLSNKTNCELEQAFVVEGEKSIQEFLREGFIPSELYSTIPYDGALKIDPSWMARISFLKNPTSLLAVFNLPAEPFRLMNQNVILLDTIQDPGNLGTILRIADWYGIKDVIVNKTCAYAYAPKVVQASMGSLARVRVHTADLNQFIKDYPSIQFIATTLNGKSMHEWRRRDDHSPLGIVIGSEGQGLEESIIKNCNDQITIPRLGAAESLNAAVATGILCSHLFK